MKAKWILVANAAHARLLQCEDKGRLTLLETFEHPASRLRSSLLGSGKPGREPSGHGFGGVAFGPRLDAQHKERMKFARELSERLEEGAHKGAYESLEIFASNPFLGELKQELGDGTRRLLVEKHDIDLTSVGLAELGRRMAQARAPEQGKGS